MGWTTGSAVTAREASTRRPKILVSYRRDDSADIVGRVYDRLTARYGAGSVFLDIDSIPYAKDFRDRVRDTLDKSDAVLAIVGPQWRGQTHDRVRIMEDDDPVRVEIERALEVNVPVFPLLVKRATMPTASELPKSLERFAYLNAATIDSGRDFHHHVDLLTASLDATLGLPPPPAAKQPNSAATILRNPSTWAVVALLALAIAAGFAGVAPPWPPGAGPIAGILAAIAFVALEQRLRDRRSAAKRAMAVAAVVLVLVGCGYLAASSEYVFAAPNNDRYVKGFVCTPDALLLYKDKCPNLGLDELRGAEYEAERLWTEQSIAIVRVALDALWCTTFVALAVLVAGLRAKVQEPAEIRAKRTVALSLLAAALAMGLPSRPAFADPPAGRSWAHYFAVKTVMQHLYDADSIQASRLKEATSKYDLSNCEMGSTYTGNGKPTVTSEFADIAFDVIVWREAFTKLGYPANLWQPALVEYEQVEVDRAIALPTPTYFAASAQDAPDASAPAMRAMIRKLDAYRAQHPTLPELISEGGCGGGGGATVSIATEPLAVQVLFIPTFFYDLCKVQKQNADDPNTCPQWREAVQGKLESVAGDYRYLVRWPDGVLRRGKLTFDMGDDGHTITLRKP